jgi:hypothetical protein
MNNSKISYKSVVIQDDKKAVKEFHLNRLEQLSLKTIGAVPWIEESGEEQKEWVKRRMRGSARGWEAFNNNG